MRISWNRSSAFRSRNLRSDADLGTGSSIATWGAAVGRRCFVAYSSPTSKTKHAARSSSFGALLNTFDLSSTLTVASVHKSVHVQECQDCLTSWLVIGKLRSVALSSEARNDALLDVLLRALTLVWSSCSSSGDSEYRLSRFSCVYIKLRFLLLIAGVPFPAVLPNRPTRRQEVSCNGGLVRNSAFAGRVPTNRS